LLLTTTGGGKEIFHALTMDRIFSTREEAEQAGVELAQKWIDDGKPAFGHDPRRDRAKDGRISPAMKANPIIPQFPKTR
jgi:hypothetical protein